jgi:hypothetical protein
MEVAVVNGLRIARRVIIPSDRGQRLKENRLKILQENDGTILVSIDTYDHQTGKYVGSGAVEIRNGHAGGKKQALLIPLTKAVDMALELKHVAPRAGIEGWGEK